MKMRIVIAVLIGAVGCFSSHGWAGDKKKDDPKDEGGKDVVVNGELINADLKDKVRTNSFCKTYTYKMIEGRTYKLNLNSTWDNYLRLENPEGQEVAADDDSGGFPNAQIIYRAAKTGEFTIICTSFSGGATGKFTLTVKDTTPAGLVNKKEKAGGTIELKNVKGGAEFSGEIVAGDSLYQQKIHKLFVFEMEAGKSYQIDHMSKKFDCYLYLEDPNGNILAEDDDAGEGLNSRIVHKAAKAGKYRIIATSLGGRSTGEFTLSIRQTDGALPKDVKDKREGLNQANPALERIPSVIRSAPAQPRD